jgi:hypothetical protein
VPEITSESLQQSDFQWITMGNSRQGRDWCNSNQDWILKKKIVLHSQPSKWPFPILNEA